VDKDLNSANQNKNRKTSTPFIKDVQNAVPVQQVQPPVLKKPVQNSNLQPNIVKESPSANSSVEPSIINDSKAIVTVPDASDSKKPFVFVAIGIIVLVIVGAGGFYLYTQFTKPKELTNQELTISPKPTVAEIITPTATPNLDPTQNWKSYTDQSSGYTIKYPKEFELTGVNEGLFEGVSLSFYGPDQVKYSELADGVIFTVLALKNIEDTLEAFVLTQKSIDIEPEDIVATDTFQVVIGGRNGYEYKLSGHGTTRVMFVQNGSIITKISVQTEGLGENLINYNNNVENILETITFTSIIEDESDNEESTDSSEPST
jgi:hypothetical protein